MISSRVALLLPLLAFAPPAFSDEPYAKRTDWTSYWNGELNISVFVFRDANRDGIYDLGDRPMSGIMVDAVGAGRVKTSVSNASGFANFEMYASDPTGDITSAGTYTFETLVPPGWSVTTNNASQVTTFQLLPGAPADMVSIPPPRLVGLMPDLTISGRLSNPQTEVAARTPAGETVEISNAGGVFSVPVEPGAWSLEARTGTESHVIEGLAVEQTPLVLSDAALRETEPLKGNPVSVSFDDLIGEGLLKIPSGYGGLRWDNFVATHQKFYDPEGYRNSVMSGEFGAYNGSGHPTAIFSDKPFSFEGGYFGASSLEAEGETLRIKAWRGDDLAYEEELTLSALGPVHFIAHFRDITRMDFSTAHYWQFVADDLRFDQ